MYETPLKPCVGRQGDGDKPRGWVRGRSPGGGGGWEAWCGQVSSFTCYRTVATRHHRIFSLPLDPDRSFTNTACWSGRTLFTSDDCTCSNGTLRSGCRPGLGKARGTADRRGATHYSYPLFKIPFFPPTSILLLF